MTDKINREGWLNVAKDKLAVEFFTNAGYVLPEKLAVSCGWTKGSKSIGECWKPTVCEDNTTHMFISPSRDNELDILQILLHEMIHAWDGCENGHKGPFVKMMKEFGMAGKPTATYAEEGSELEERLKIVRDSVRFAVGPYPHVAMNKGAGKKKPNPNAWLRFYSINADSYKVVVSPKQVEEYGVPLDPWGDRMEEVVK